MIKKIKVSEVKQPAVVEEIEIEVQFPLFSDDYDNGENGEWTTFTRIDENLNRIKIIQRKFWHFDQCDYDIEFSDAKSLFEGISKSSLNQYYHDPSKFNQALKELKEDLKYVWPNS